MKKLLSIVLPLFLIAGCTSSSNSTGMKTGTYEGVGEGFHGEIKLNVTVDETSIKSIDVVHHVVSTDKQWFGDAYTPQETAALVDIARDDIYNQVSSDLSYRHEAQANFENFIIKFAQNLGVSKVYFEAIEF